MVVVTGMAGSTGLGGTGVIQPPACVGTCVCMPGVPATTQVPRMTRLQYDTVVKELLGVTTLTSASNQPPSSLLSEDSAGALTDIAWNGYLSAAEKIATEVIASTTNKSKFITCADATQATCLTDTIRAFGRKAFRRPLTDAEVTSFLRFRTLTPAGTSNEVAESVLFAMLASPSFISLPELGETAEGTALKLTSHEVATRLSFLLWNSVGDAELNTAADGGMLTTGAQIKAQALRMLQSPKAAAVASAFHRAYAYIATSHAVDEQHHALAPRLHHRVLYRRDGGAGCVLPGRGRQRRHVRRPVHESGWVRHEGHRLASTA